MPYTQTVECVKSCLVEHGSQSDFLGHCFNVCNAWCEIKPIGTDFHSIIHTLTDFLLVLFIITALIGVVWIIVRRTR